MPEFTEEQLNAVAEELFERMAVTMEAEKALMDQPVPPALSKEVPEPVTQLSDVGKEEIQAEAAKALAKSEHDPIVPKQMTRQVWKQMMRIHFTVRRGLAQPCGHKLSTIMVPDDKGKQSVFITSDPRKNCESCWFTYFNTNGQMTQIADDCFQNAGRDVLERSRGKKFVKYFLMFMSTMARFQREAAERATRTFKKENADGVETESADTGAGGSVGGRDFTTDQGVTGVAGEAEGIVNDNTGDRVGDGSEGSVDEGPIEGLGVGVGSVRQGLGDETQPDPAGE
jgi:hypothetical protein